MVNEMNHVSNLEWCTRSENIQHSYDELGRISPRGWGNGKTKYSDDQIEDMKARSKQGQSFKSIARYYNCSATYISDVIHNRRRQVLGFANEPS